MKTSKKKSITFVLLAVVLTLALGIGVLLLTNNSILDRIFINKTEKDVLVMADKFYQEFYYPLVTNGKSQQQIEELLSEKEITIPISEIVKISEIDVKDIYESLNKKKDTYDWELSTIKIKATSPYKITDYEVKVDLAKH